MSGAACLTISEASFGNCCAVPTAHPSKINTRTYSKGYPPRRNWSNVTLLGRIRRLIFSKKKWDRKSYSMLRRFEKIACNSLFEGVASWWSPYVVAETVCYALIVSRLIKHVDIALLTLMYCAKSISTSASLNDHTLLVTWFLLISYMSSCWDDVISFAQSWILHIHQLMYLWIISFLLFK